jgi:hypothetical protein
MLAPEYLLRDYGESTLVPFFRAVLILPLPQAAATLSGEAQTQEENDDIVVKQQGRLLRLLELLLRTRSVHALQQLAPLLFCIARAGCDTSLRLQTQYAKLIPGYLTVLARAAFEYDTDTLRAAVFPIGMSASVNLLTLVDAWVQSFSTISSSPFGVWRRKLWAVALCKQLVDSVATDATLFRARLPAVIELWQDVFADLRTEEQNKVALENVLQAQSCSTNFSARQAASLAQYPNFQQKRTQLVLDDLVYTIDLRLVLRQTITGCESNAMPGLVRAIIESDEQLKRITDHVA